MIIVSEFTGLFQNKNKANHTGSNCDGSAEAVTVSWGLERMNLCDNTTS